MGLGTHLEVAFLESLGFLLSSSPQLYAPFLSLRSLISDANTSGSLFGPGLRYKRSPPELLGHLDENLAVVRFEDTSNVRVVYDFFTASRIS